MSRKYTPDEILESLDGAQRAEPNPFLFTRIVARMTKEETGFFAKVFKIITAPAFSLGITILFVIINGYFMMKNTGKNTIDSADYNQEIAAEYNQHALNPYELPK